MIQGFIQDQHPVATSQGPGKNEPLGLAAGDQGTTLAELSLESIGQ